MNINDISDRALAQAVRELLADHYRVAPVVDTLDDVVRRAAEIDAAEPAPKPSLVVENLAMMIRVLVRRLRKAGLDDEWCVRAMTLLRTYALEGSVLRTTTYERPLADVCREFVLSVGDEFGNEAGCRLRNLFEILTDPAPAPAAAVLDGSSELEFLEQWLQYAAEPIGQECCGRRQGLECCGCPDPVYREPQDVLNEMIIRHAELVASLAAAPKPQEQRS